MQAIIQQRYGEAAVLELAEVATPLPAPDEVRVRIGASSVTAADMMMRRGSPWYGRLLLGLFAPKHPIIGTGFSGVVDKVGAAVTAFEVGQPVYGESVLGAGTNCEYVCVPQHGVIVKAPHGMSDEQLAPVCDGMLTSWYFLKHMVAIKPGHRVLINGAAGSLGGAAIQLAKLDGAHVTAVCSPVNHDLVRELGADAVIDYHTTDFTTTGPYEVIYDAVGKRRYGQCEAALTESGRYLSPVLSLSLLCAVLRKKYSKGRRAMFAATGLLPEQQRREMLTTINGYLANGQLRTVTPHRYQLHQIVEAHRLIETGHRHGNVVLIMDD